MSFVPFDRNLRSLLRDRRGVVGIYFAIVLTSIVLLSMAALDLIRVHLIRSRLWAATDASLLAAGRALGDADWAEQAASYFNANMGDSYMGAKVEVTAADFVISGDPFTGQYVSLSVKAPVPLISFGLIELGNLNLEVNAKARRITTNVELAMVLDNTGSMEGSKIAALRADALELVSILAGGATTGQLANSKIALVPYSAAVNPGAEAANLVSGKQTPSSDVLGWKGCVLERLNANGMADTTANVEKWEPYIWTHADDNFYTPGDAKTVRLNSKDGNSNTGPNLGCPTAIVPLTTDITALRSAINAMQAWNRGGTLSDIGMAWGRRVLSPEAPFTQGEIWNHPTMGKAVVLMTDGETQFFKLASDAPPNKVNKDKNVLSDYTGYDRLEKNRIGTTNANTAKTKINDRLGSVCTDLKSKNVQIYTITFGVSDSATKTIYENCASSKNYYFNAPDSQTLKSAFQSIGGSLSELVLVQ